MLEKTFIHVPGIGADVERSLWDQGCLSWQDLMNESSDYSCGAADRKKVIGTLKRSVRAIECGEHQFFRRRLGPKEAWRAYPNFRHSCVFLDIETDGRNSGDGVTTVGLYDGVSYRCLTKGVDLGNFPDIISQYSMIVTFFGASFDLPLLQRRFPLHKMDQIHLDLCPILRRVGIRGGLKKIEKQFGIARSPDTEGLTGYDAVKLWRRYQHAGDERALEVLIAYNREDVVNLQPLAERAYKEMWEQTHGDRFAAA